jgi:uncharacterized protein
VKFTQDAAEGVNLITSYDDGAIRLRQRVISGPVVVTPSSIVEDVPVSAAEPVALAALEAVLALAPDVIVLGTGARLRFPAAGVRAHVQALGIGLEVMDTGAACRTYNVLALEGRNVVALLLP